MRLPRKPQYVRVELDADMAGPGPLRGGRWPGRKRTLTYHYFGATKLRAGDRVAVNDGLYKDCFGTVLGRAWRYRGYTYGVRRTKTRTVTFTETVARAAEFEVA